MKSAHIHQILAVLCVSSAVFAWDAGLLQVEVQKNPMNIKVLGEGESLVEITRFDIGSDQITEIVSESTEGDNLVLNLPSNRKVTVSKVHRGVRFYSKNDGANQFVVYYKDEEDHFYGISGESYFDDPVVRNDIMDMRGKKRSVGYLADAGMDTWYTGAWSTFFMSTGRYASFWDTWYKGEYDFTADNGEIRLKHNSGELDWCIFYGKNGVEIHEGYFKRISEVEGRHTPKKIPMWALGPMYWQNDISNRGKVEILEEAHAYTDREIASTGMWVDRPYGPGTKGWDLELVQGWADQFKPPEVWIDSLQDHFNIKVLTWIAPQGNVKGCDDCVENTDRWDWTNSHFTTWFEEYLKQYHYDYGIIGHKIDRAGFYAHQPNGKYSDGTPAEPARQMYPYLTAKGTDEIIRNYLGDDQYIFATFTYNRSQPYLSALWNGDARQAWPGLKTTITQAMRAAFMGYPVWGSDGGGYSDQLPQGGVDGGTNGKMRWFELELWSGLFQVNRGYHNFDLGEKAVSVYRDVAEHRMKLLPYIYSIANTAHKTGVMMRPMAYMYMDDPQTYHMGHQFMFGPTFLVAPVFEDATSREVYLPEGKWINLYDLADERSGKETINAAAPIERFPVFVKKNSIYLSGQIYPGNQIHWIDNYEATKHVDVNVFPGAAGESVSFPYIDYLDNDTEKPITMQSQSDNIVTLQFPAMKVPGKILARIEGNPTKVFMNGTETSDYTYDAATKVLSAPFEANTAITFQIGGQEVLARTVSAPSLKRKLDFSFNGSRLHVTFDEATGSRMKRQPMSIGLYDVQGRCCLLKHIDANDLSGTSLVIPVENAINHNGMYLIRCSLKNGDAFHTTGMITNR